MLGILEYIAKKITSGRILHFKFINPEIGHWEDTFEIVSFIASSARNNDMCTEVACFADKCSGQL